jgi:hypothetical protein
VLEKIVDEKVMGSVHELFFFGDVLPLPNPNSSNGGGSDDDGSLGELSSVNHHSLAFPLVKGAGSGMEP